MYILPNLNLSTFSAEAVAHRFAGRLKRSVVMFKISRLWSDRMSKASEQFEYNDKKSKRGKWTGGKQPLAEDRFKLESGFLLKKSAISDKCYNETSYYFENGLRKVYPYYYTFTAFTKARWVGKTIFEVFAQEFRDLSPEEYEQGINTGMIMVNYQRISKDYKLKCNDLLVKVVHRHEYPVLYQEIPIIHKDENILVVNKPSSIPVHPCGRFRYNSVLVVLAKEHNLTNLFTIHRLDRLTSGLLMFGMSNSKTKEIIKQMKNRLVNKEYVCRVDGEFPDNEIVCTHPIQIINKKMGFAVVNPAGKECVTHFKKISSNGKNSLVLCIPKTGRTHQIRVHLQYLGFPIVNDYLYNDTVVFGPLKGKGGDFNGKNHEQLYKDLLHLHIENTYNVNNITLNHYEKSQSVGKSHNTYSDEQGIRTNQNTFDLAFNADKMTVAKNCFECKFPYVNPKPENLVMYLHALKYEGLGWKYETGFPNWARSDWIDTI